MMSWHKVPGKLILSGEHAVIYKQPALAVAVKKFVKIKLKPQAGEIISFYSHDLDTQAHYGINDLLKKYLSIKNKYQQFLQHQQPIHTVLSNKLDLIIYTTGYLLKHFNLAIKTGFSLSISSEIPIGCGMGSSAAVILSLMRAFLNYYQCTATTKEQLILAKDIENLCHGQSSGFDLYTIQSGGCILLNDKHYSSLPLKLPSVSIINTGKPSSSTGACVSHARQYLKDTQLLNEFKTTTLQLYAHLKQNNAPLIHQLIRKNHRLLIKIGIVPRRIQNFIKQLEQTGASAKICGAGSIAGDNAGYCLIYGASQKTKNFLKKMPYLIEPLMLFNH